MEIKGAEGQALQVWGLGVRGVRWVFHASIELTSVLGPGGPGPARAWGQSLMIKQLLTRRWVCPGVPAIVQLDTLSQCRWSLTGVRIRRDEDTATHGGTAT